MSTATEPPLDWPSATDQLAGVIIEKERRETFAVAQIREALGCIEDMRSFIERATAQPCSAALHAATALRLAIEMLGSGEML